MPGVFEEYRLDVQLDRRRSEPFRLPAPIIESELCPAAMPHTVLKAGQRVRLCVSLERASELRDIGGTALSSQDPFAILTFRVGERELTSVRSAVVHDGGTHPVFGPFRAVADFLVSRDDEPVQIELELRHERGTISPEMHIGKSTIDVRTLARGWNVVHAPVTYMGTPAGTAFVDVLLEAIASEEHCPEIALDTLEEAIRSVDAFRALDRDADGRLSVADVTETLQILGLQHDRPTVDSILETIGTTLDGFAWSMSAVRVKPVASTRAVTAVLAPSMPASSNGVLQQFLADSVDECFSTIVAVLRGYEPDEIGSMTLAAHVSGCKALAPTATAASLRGMVLCKERFTPSSATQQPQLRLRLAQARVESSINLHSLRPGWNNALRVPIRMTAKHEGSLLVDVMILGRVNTDQGTMHDVEGVRAAIASGTSHASDDEPASPSMAPLSLLRQLLATLKPRVPKNIPSIVRWMEMDDMSKLRAAAIFRNVSALSLRLCHGEQAERACRSLLAIANAGPDDLSDLALVCLAHLARDHNCRDLIARHEPILSAMLPSTNRKERQLAGLLALTNLVAIPWPAGSALPDTVGLLATHALDSGDSQLRHLGACLARNLVLQPHITIMELAGLHPALCRALEPSDLNTTTHAAVALTIWQERIRESDRIGDDAARRMVHLLTTTADAAHEDEAIAVAELLISECHEIDLHLIQDSILALLQSWQEDLALRGARLAARIATRRDGRSCLARHDQVVRRLLELLTSGSPAIERHAANTLQWLCAVDPSIVLDDTPVASRLATLLGDAWRLAPEDDDGGGERPDSLEATSTATTAHSQLLRVFRSFDSSKDGLLDHGEVEVCLRGLGVEVDDLPQFIDRADSSRDGRISLAEFLDLAHALCVQAGARAHDALAWLTSDDASTSDDAWTALLHRSTQAASIHASVIRVDATSERADETPFRVRMTMRAETDLQVATSTLQSSTGPILPILHASAPCPKESALTLIVEILADDDDSTSHLQASSEPLRLEASAIGRHTTSLDIPDRYRVTIAWLVQT